jgi:hypothetical protein
MGEVRDRLTYNIGIAHDALFGRVVFACTVHVQGLQSRETPRQPLRVIYILFRNCLTKSWGTLPRHSCPYTRHK